MVQERKTATRTRGRGHAIPGSCIMDNQDADIRRMSSDLAQLDGTNGALLYVVTHILSTSRRLYRLWCDIEHTSRTLRSPLASFPRAGRLLYVPPPYPVQRGSHVPLVAMFGCRGCQMRKSLRSWTPPGWTLQHAAPCSSLWCVLECRSLLESMVRD